MARDDARTVRDVVDFMAAVRGDAPFLIAPGTEAAVTFAGLRRDSQALAARLAGLGLVKGDRVALLLDNGPGLAELLIGTFYAGLVPVPLSVHAGQARTESLLAHSEPRAVFVAPEHEALLEGWRLAAGPVRLVRAHPDRGPDWGETPAPPARLAELDEGDDALLAYTSGSTGTPKGVLLTQRGVMASAANVARALDLSPADRTLCVMPLVHRSAQNTALMATLFSGGSVVLPPRFEARSFWDLVCGYRCTWFGLVPARVAQLLSEAESLVRPGALAHVRFARSSSAPLVSTVHREFEARFGVPLLEGMGQTEAGSTIFSNRPPPARRKAGSVGTACGFDVKIVGDAGDALPAGGVGEILVRSPSVMKGYYRGEAATAEVLTPDGWLRTGDLGYQDEDGYVFLVGRAREVINKGGVKIAPREIDEVLLRHPAVLEAAAVGVPDTYLGHDVVAWVALHPGAACPADELLAFCVRELGPIRAPASIHFAEVLPKGPSGKVQRSQLSEEAARTRIAAPARPTRPRRAAGAYVAPRTSIERVLCEAWGAVLDRDPIGVYDEFFVLGGDSLRAMRILTRLSGSLPVRLSFTAFFEHPTVAEQAELIDYELLHRVGDGAAQDVLQEIERLAPEDVAGRLRAHGNAPGRDAMTEAP